MLWYSLPNEVRDMIRASAVFSAVLLLLVCSASAGTWYITPDGLGDAPTIQAGIDSSAAGDTVLVACGTYYDCTHPTPDGYLACVTMKSGVALLGETGDAACVTIDAQGLGRCLDCDSVDADASVQGFTITGGLVDGAGGGMRCGDAALGLSNLVFTLNQARYGGGLSIAGSPAPVIADCVFSDNTATSGGGGARTWGYGDVSVGFLRCEFAGNQASSGGGAIDCIQRKLELEECILTDNNGGGGGGAVRLSDTGSDGTGTRFTGCIFAGNHASWGSAIEADGDVLISVISCTLYGNYGSSGALFIYDNIWYERAGLAVWYTIIANTVGLPIDTMNSESPYAACSNFNGNSLGDWVGDWAYLNGIYGNFSACPSFCYALQGDFHLCDESPCLPGNHPYGYECGLIGAWGEGCSCGPTRTEPATWGAVKAMYR
jgi:hypothetical protein